MEGGNSLSQQLVFLCEVQKTGSIFTWNTSTTDYLYLGDEKKKSSRIPLALLLSPDRADMDCGIDRLSREI